MSANLRTFTKAIYGLDHVVRLVPDDAWSNPSPCEEWTAHDVLGHVIGGLRMYVEPHVREIAPPKLDVWQSPASIAGDDPVGAWSAVRDDVLEAVDSRGVINRVVETFRGHETIDSLLGFAVVDILVHSWDLARAAGVDDQLDPILVEHASREIEPMLPFARERGFYAPPVATADGSDRTEQFLAMLGRTVD